MDAPTNGGSDTIALSIIFNTKNGQIQLQHPDNMLLGLGLLDIARQVLLDRMKGGGAQPASGLVIPQMILRRSGM